MHIGKSTLIQLMKKYTSIALIGVLVVGMAGFISLDAFSATSFTTMKVASDVHETGKMIGHVTYELRGVDGNIKHYFQSDNVIVDLGTDCAATAIFDTDDGSGICTLGGNGGFAFIAIGNATGKTAGATNVTLAISDGGSANFGAGGGDEVVRSQNIIDALITPAVGTGADTTVSIASLPFTFTDLGTSGTKITQSGLFDSAAGGNMFSIRDIPGIDGSGLGVLTADTLSVTWTITLE